MQIQKLFFAVFLGIGACGGPVDRYYVPPEQVAETVRISYRSVEIREVTLPTYAASEEIALQGQNGALKSSGAALWADAPERAVALEITRNLVQLTGATIASDPWPFRSIPDARLEVRFESLIANSDGKFRASGQYFVATETGRERVELFNLLVPYDIDAGPSEIVRARGKIILDLSMLIAREGLR